MYIELTFLVSTYELCPRKSLYPPQTPNLCLKSVQEMLQKFVSFVIHILEFQIETALLHNHDYL